MSHPFIVGKTYRNRMGEYVVQAIDGDRMIIRYASGGTLETSAGIQNRIWENIQFEEQMAREEERERLAKEARAASRARSSRAKAEAVIVRFDGFQKSDFEPKKRGIAWSSREIMGKFLVQELGGLTKKKWGQWIIPRKSAIQVAREGHYVRDKRDTLASFAVSVGEDGVTHGFRVGKAEGEAKIDSHWLAFLAALAEDKKVQRELRATMKEHEMTMDVYTMDVSYGLVGQVEYQPRGFLWREEGQDQSVTKRMNWPKLIDHLAELSAEERCHIFIGKTMAPKEALEAGKQAAKEIEGLFQALLPVYDATLET